MFNEAENLEATTNPLSGLKSRKKVRCYPNCLSSGRNTSHLERESAVKEKTSEKLFTLKQWFEF